MGWILPILGFAKTVGLSLLKLTRLRRMQNTTLGGIASLASQAVLLFGDMTPLAALQDIATWTIPEWYVRLPQILVSLGIIAYDEDGAAKRLSIQHKAEVEKIAAEKLRLTEGHKKEIEEIYLKKISAVQVDTLKEVGRAMADRKAKVNKNDPV